MINTRPLTIRLKPGLRRFEVGRAYEIETIDNRVLIGIGCLGWAVGIEGSAPVVFFESGPPFIPMSAVNEARDVTAHYGL